jgi:hypothetical protein
MGTRSGKPDRTALFCAMQQTGFCTNKFFLSSFVAAQRKQASDVSF